MGFVGRASALLDRSPDAPSGRGGSLKEALLDLRFSGDSGDVPSASPTLRWLESLWGSGEGAAGTWISLQGWSMAPTLRPGDRLLVRPLAGAPPASEGEIVVARRGTRLVAHRLVENVGAFAITRGDVCHAVDLPVLLQTLLGRVVLVRRSSRRPHPWRRLKLTFDRIRRSL